MKLDILDARSLKNLATLDDEEQLLERNQIFNKSSFQMTVIESSTSIADIKRIFHQKKPKYYQSRQSFKLEPKGKSLKDTDTIGSLEITADNAQLYFKDLGIQVGWTTVFLAEYAGPLAVYLFLYMRPSVIYGIDAAAKPMEQVVHIAAQCWSVHYLKRLLETLFVHRFSKGTMPILNLFKNCGYYWGFGFLVGYFINHPLYTAPRCLSNLCTGFVSEFGDVQVYGALAGFLINEFGNFSIHMLLRNLRPAGSTERRIPYPNSNPMTQLFRFVSCPNYTYETGAWICFTIMTQTFGTALFTLAGFYQMTVWALGKHRNYRKEFPDYPRRRRAIVPFFI